MPDLRVISGGSDLMPLSVEKIDAETLVVMPESATTTGNGSKLDPAAAALTVLREYEVAYGADGVPPVPVEDIAESHWTS
jgi:hypothetical protein